MSTSSPPASAPDAPIDLAAIAAARPDLDALYAPPAERIQNAVLDHLADFHLRFLAEATFFCLATASADALDASPRGGPPGFVHALDARHVAFADWPGNNRIESLRNLEHDARVGLLFLFPGAEVFMRINGRARASTEPALLARVADGAARLPKAAIVVEITQVLLHCGKAINRAKLWSPESQLAADKLPTVGAVMVALAKQAGSADPMGDTPAEQIDANYQHAVRNDLY
jgi:PPOX class probable FMN-dependent enzyme